MQVNFYATLRQTAGRKRFELEMPQPGTPRSVLEAITRDCAPLASELWQATGILFEHIHVFVNGRELRHLPQGIDTPLQAQDVLDVFPPVGGGAAHAG